MRGERTISEVEWDYGHSTCQDNTYEVATLETLFVSSVLYHTLNKNKRRCNLLGNGSTVSRVVLRSL